VSRTRVQLPFSVLNHRWLGTIFELCDLVVKEQDANVILERVSQRVYSLEIQRHATSTLHKSKASGAYTTRRTSTAEIPLLR
jgi:hypothetical protein